MKQLRSSLGFSLVATTAANRAAIPALTMLTVCTFRAVRFPIVVLGHLLPLYLRPVANKIQFQVRPKLTAPWLPHTEYKATSPWMLMNRTLIARHCYRDRIVWPSRCCDYDRGRTRFAGHDKLSAFRRGIRQFNFTVRQNAQVDFLARWVIRIGHTLRLPASRTTECNLVVHIRV